MHTKMKNQTKSSRLGKHALFHWFVYMNPLFIFNKKNIRVNVEENDSKTKRNPNPNPFKGPTIDSIRKKMGKSWR